MLRPGPPAAAALACDAEQPRLARRSRGAVGSHRPGRAARRHRPGGGLTPPFKFLPSWRQAAASLRSPRSAVLVVVFLVTAGMGMVWSILAGHAAALGASTAMGGLLITAFGGARLAVNLPAGI